MSGIPRRRTKGGGTYQSGRLGSAHATDARIGRFMSSPSNRCCRERDHRARYASQRVSGQGRLRPWSHPKNSTARSHNPRGRSTAPRAQPCPAWHLQCRRRCPHALHWARHRAGVPLWPSPPEGAVAPPDGPRPPPVPEAPVATPETPAFSLLETCPPQA